MFEIKDSNFNEKIKNDSEKIKIIKLWASWCGPCKIIKPILEEISEGPFKNNIDVYELNVDENPDIPIRFKVRTVPTLLLFKNGELFDEICGIFSKDKLEKIIERKI